MRFHYREGLALLSEDVVMDSTALAGQPYEDGAILLGDEVPQPHRAAL